MTGSEDVASVDEAPLGLVQIRIFLICSFVMFFDGFDTQAIGYVAPLLAQATHASLASFGIIFSIGLAGAASGAFLFGPLGDYFGRRWLLVIACAAFATFSLGTVFVTSTTELMFVRFLTGLGLGGAVPTSLALVSEYAPKRFKAWSMTAMFAAFPLGGFVGGLAASILVSRFGWQSVFLAGGIAPAFACIAIALWVPESAQYLASRRNRDQPDQFASDPDPHNHGVLKPSSSVLKQMLGAKQFRVTLLLWVPFFLGFMVVLSVVLWGPSLLRETGMPLSVATLIFAIHFLGGFVGTAFSGYLVDRFGAKRVIVPAFLVGAICLGSFGFLIWSPLALCVIAFFCGVLLAGASNGLLPIAAALYPTHLRSTGIGWAMGAGRFGQLVGPMLIGLMVAAKLPSSTIFLTAVVPCIVSAAFVWLVTGRSRNAWPAEAADVESWDPKAAKT